MADSDFKISITADASKAVTGAQTAQEALAKVGTAGGKAGENTGKGADVASGKWKEAKKAFAELGKEFPVIGALGRVLFNPLALGAAAATYVIQRLKGDILALNESLTTSDWEGYGAVVAAQKKAMDEATLGASSFAREMERIRDATETASAAGEKLLSVFRAQMNAQDRLDAARKAMEVAQVQAGEKDPVRKQARLLEIEERYAARKRQREDETSRFELEQQRKKMINEQAAVASLDKQLEGAREKQSGLKSEAQVNEKLRVEKGRLATIEDELNKKSERHQVLKDKTWGTRSTPEQMEMKELGGQLDSLARQRDQQRGVVGRLERRAPGLIETYRGSQEAVSMLETMRRGAAERANGIAANLPTQERVAAIEGGARAEVGRMDSATRMAQAAATGQAEQGRLIEEATKQVERTGSVAKQTADALGRQGDFNAAVTEYLKRLESQMGNMRH